MTVAKIVIALAIAVLLAPAMAGQVGSPTSTVASTVPTAASAPEAIQLEREKFAYQKELEEKKLEVERLKAWATGGSILIPLLLGIFTLAWQSKATSLQRDRDARDAFELKVADIVLSGNNTVATKNKAKAFVALFPNKLPSNFGDAFEPEKFGGPRYESKLEVFKAACEKVQAPEEVYEIWRRLFPQDAWLPTVA